MTGISQALGLFGTGVIFIGAVTGVGLFIGWRRALARYSRRARELRNAVEKRNTALNTALANFTGAGKLSAIAIPLPGTGAPDAPISRSQLGEVIGAVQRVIGGAQTEIQAEIQKVANDVRTVRTAVATVVTDEGVEATTRAMLAEYEHREAAVTLRDLQWALAGIAIQAAGAMITGLGLIVGM